MQLNNFRPLQTHAIALCFVLSCTSAINATTLPSYGSSLTIDGTITVEYLRNGRLFSVYETHLYISGHAFNGVNWDHEYVTEEYCAGPCDGDFSKRVYEDFNIRFDFQVSGLLGKPQIDRNYFVIYTNSEYTWKWDDDYDSTVIHENRNVSGSYRVEKDAFVFGEPGWGERTRFFFYLATSSQAGQSGHEDGTVLPPVIRETGRLIYQRNPPPGGWNPGVVPIPPSAALLLSAMAVSAMVLRRSAQGRAHGVGCSPLSAISWTASRSGGRR